MNYVLLCICLTVCGFIVTLIYLKCIIKYTNVRSTKIHPEIPVAQAIIMSPVIVVPQHVVTDHYSSQHWNQ